MQDLKVSIMMPALNEEKNIGRCIDSINRHFPKQFPFEVLVGDHGSRDSTVSIAQSRGARVVNHKGGTVGELRNLLASNCTGNIFIFLDADTEVTEAWGAKIGDVINGIKSNPLQIAGSMCTAPTIQNPFIENWFSKMPKKETNYLGTAHLITSKQLFDTLEGFAKGLRSGEDYDFCMRAQQRAGATLNIQPALVVFHHDYPLTAKAFVTREAWHGSGDFQSLEKFSQSKVAKLTVVFFLFVASAIVTVPFNMRLSILLLVASLTISLLASFTKFRNLAPRERAVNASIFYLYFLGRSISLLAETRKFLGTFFSDRKNATQ